MVDQEYNGKKIFWFGNSIWEMIKYDGTNPEIQLKNWEFPVRPSSAGLNVGRAFRQSFDSCYSLGEKKRSDVLSGADHCPSGWPSCDWLSSTWLPSHPVGGGGGGWWVQEGTAAQRHDSIVPLRYHIPAWLLQHSCNNTPVLKTRQKKQKQKHTTK